MARCVPSNGLKNRPYHRKTQPNKTAVADASKTAESAAPAASAPKAVSEASPETKNGQYPLKTKRIGNTALFVEVATQIGLCEDFSKTWGETVCSVACHWLTTAHNAAYLFKS